MNKQLMAIAFTSALVGTLNTANFASAQIPRPDTTNDPAAKTPTPSAIGGASAPGARLAALITVNVNRTVTVFRSKGVAAVTSPSVGLVCIQPSPSLPVTQIVPVLSIDFSNSVVGHNMAEYRSSGIGCPTGNIAVRTFVAFVNSPVPLLEKRPDDGVAFTIVVP